MPTVQAGRGIERRPSDGNDCSTTPVRIGLLLAAVLGIGGCSDGGASASDSTRPTSAAPSAGDTLFTDPFDDDANGWALPENENSRTEVLGGDFVWEAKRAAADLRPHVLAAPLADAFDRGDGPQMRNVVVRASVTPERGTGAMGVFCREVRDTDTDFQWYEFVARDGFAAIRRGDSAGHLDVLASTHDLDLPLGREATLEAACVDDAERPSPAVAQRRRHRRPGRARPAPAGEWPRRVAGLRLARQGQQGQVPDPLARLHHLPAGVLTGRPEIPQNDTTGGSACLEHE